MWRFYTGQSSYTCYPPFHRYLNSSSQKPMGKGPRKLHWHIQCVGMASKWCPGWQSMHCWKRNLVSYLFITMIKMFNLNNGTMVFGSEISLVVDRSHLSRSMARQMPRWKQNRVEFLELSSQMPANNGQAVWRQDTPSEIPTQWPSPLFPNGQPSRESRHRSTHHLRQRRSISSLTQQYHPAL